MHGFQMKKTLRSYTIASESDKQNTENGRCPDYALTWDLSYNKKYWSEDADFYLGNGENVTEKKELRELLSNRLKSGKNHKMLLFCDLDGVLADFEAGVFNKFKKPINEIHPGILWNVINKSSSFFETLPWMQKGQELWESIKQYDPIILTGVPPGSLTGAEQKRKWCAANLGEDVTVICCKTKDKPKYSFIGSILIDDRSDNVAKWRENGGKFMLYNEGKLEEIVGDVNKYMNSDFVI